MRNFHRTRHFSHFLATLCLLIGLPLTASAEIPADGESLPDIQLNANATVGIHLTVYTNPRRQGRGSRSAGQDIVAVHGFAHTARTFDNLAQTLFATPRLGASIDHLIVVDMPGHGQSEMPQGMVYGTVTLDDYEQALKDALTRMVAAGYRPRILMGHSMGGLLIQMLQQRLLDSGTSLRSAYGIDRAVLLAAALPEELPWGFAQSGAALQVLGQFIGQSAELGVIVSIPAVVWPALFFVNHSGGLAAATPTPDEVAGRSYNAAEPLAASLQLVGAGVPRPSIVRGALSAAHGTRLVLVAGSDDALFSAAEERALYEHLTGDARCDGFRLISGADAVHDLYINQPGAILDAIGPSWR